MWLLAEGLLSSDILGASALVVPWGICFSFVWHAPLSFGDFSSYSLGLLSDCSGGLRVPLSLQQVTGFL